MKIRKTNGTLSMGQKSNFPAMALGLSLAMAAPAFAADLFKSVQDGDWGAGTTWNFGRFPDEKEPVEVRHAVAISTGMDVETSEELTIHSGGVLTQTADNMRIKRGLYIADGSAGTYDLQGGSAQVYFDDYNSRIGDGANGGLLKVSGSGEFYIGYKADEDGPLNLIINSDGTLEMNGSSASFIGDATVGGKLFQGTLIGSGTIKFTADAAGVSTVDTYLENATTLNLDIDLSAFTGSGDLTLMNIGGAGIQGAFASVMVDGDDIASTAYSIDYEGGDGNDVVLTMPSTASTLAITSISVDGTTATITMTGTDGASYICKSSTTLDGGFPTTETTVPETIVIAGGTGTFTVDASEGKKFYRIAE